MTRRRTGDWVTSARAVEYGIALTALRNVYTDWTHENAEAIDVIEAVGRFLEADAKVSFSGARPTLSPPQATRSDR